MERLMVGSLLAGLILAGWFLAGRSRESAAATAQNAEQALAAVKDGNARFVEGKTTRPNQGKDRLAETAKNGQNPIATVLSCSDSRVPVELIFDQGFGDLFVVRVAGNVADGDEIGSIEYGAGHLGVPLLVVLGHTDCGAVTAVATGAELAGSIPQLVDNIKPAVERAQRQNPQLKGKDLVPAAVRENVWQSIADVLARGPEVRELVKAKKLMIVGAIYHLDDGKVEWLGPHPEQEKMLGEK